MSTENTIKNLLAQHLIEDVPPSVIYIPDFITEEQEDSILQMVKNAPIPKWTQLSNRRLQNWGGIPHKNGMIAEDIPKWLSFFVDKIRDLEIFESDKKPNHVLINEYLAGQGIMAHSDGPLFYPIVTTISCGSHTLLEFYKSEDRKQEFSLLLEPRSLLILQKNLYHNYLHAISETEIDDISQHKIKNLDMCSEFYKGQKFLKRSKRISLTIRHVPKTSKVKIKLGK